VEKTIAVTMLANVGGPSYTVLEEGETYDLEHGFARTLVAQRRAVPADGVELEDPGVVTVNGDPLVSTDRAAKPKRTR
jgi:hypothetical protein